MLIIPPPPFRRRRGRVKRTPPVPPPPAALVLVAASFDVAGLTVTLGFDRAINLAGLDGNEIIVDDAITTGTRYTATGAVTIVNPTTVRIGLDDIESASGVSLTLTAGPANGIVASNDGGTWAGVSDLGLPFP